MFKRVAKAINRRLGLAFDYGLVGLRNPKLFMQAAKHVINRRRRRALSVVNAAANPALRGPEQTVPVTAQTLIDGLAQQMGVVLLDESDQSVVIGVADDQFLSALIYLRSQACGPAIAIGGKRVTFGTANFRQRAFAAPSVEVTFVAPSLDRGVISVEPYFRRETGEWISNNPANDALRAIRSDVLTTAGLTYARDILGGPTLAQTVNDRTVDAVYTWVNHADPDWAAAYADHSGSVQMATDADALSRFHSNDELRYSLRSVAVNAPWINRIYVLTNCAKPDWLNDEDPRLIWVDHAEVMPKAALPTFNSHAIESCLHKIPNLSEHFLYLNDDVFLARPLDKGFFFDQAGASSSFLETYGMVSGDVVEGDPDYLNASRNVAGLLRDDLGFVPTQLHQHTCFALRKSVLAEIETKWQDQFDALRANRFRTSGDLNVTSFLYHHYAIATGKARVGVVQNAFVKSMDVRWRDKLKTAAQTKYHTLCINEGGVDAPASDWHPAVQNFLRTKFPNRADWERD